jgi:hypothetical protein
MQNRIFSVDSAKAVKAQAYGWLNAIQYLAPAGFGGTKNLCVNASPACIALCLGLHSGQAGMVADADHGMNSVRQSRVDKTNRFMRDRANYLLDVVRSIDLLIARARREGFKLCVRLNGSSDVAFEGIRFEIERAPTGRATKITLSSSANNIFQHYPEIDFVDYTKIARRFDRVLPANYHLTFSRSETNEQEAIALLARGVNVAVVFAGVKPATWQGFDVIDGDLHDLRQLDPRGPQGFVIALTPKGRKAKRDTSGFVVRQ